ncbi:MAG: hypothetical protein ACXVBE_01585 [Bdellovibrionota bacterium]
MLKRNFLSHWAAPSIMSIFLAGILLSSSAKAEEAALTAGSMPYSNQWTYDEPDSFLYLSRNELSLNSDSLKFGQLESRFSGGTAAFYGVDYFARITWLSDREGDSWLRQFSLNGRYGVAGLIKKGTLSRADYQISNTSENAYLNGLRGRFGLNLSWECFWWFRPFVSLDTSPILYRHSSSLSGAEVQGGALYYGEGLGAHFPVLFKNKGTLFAEARKDRQVMDHNKLFKGDTSVDAGIGLVF